MKKRKLLLHIFCFLTLLNIAILCNESIVFAADTTAPTACRITINNDSSYTNDKFVSLDIYAEDANDMQVWISNDGVTGTVTDFEFGSTLTITDLNYVIGTTLDSSNSTTTSNSDNVFRIQNWPVEDGNGARTVRVVFNDAYGNKTPVDAYDAITITYDLNGNTGTTPQSVETLPGLNVYIPEIPSTGCSVFVGWSTSPTASIANYYANTSVSFNEDITLYAVFENKTIADMVYDNELSVGDYVAYIPDTKTYSTIAANTGADSVRLTTANTTWRILDIKEDTGEVILTTDGVVYPLGIDLIGEQGYVNGSTELHNISKALYSNEALDITAESMTIEVLNEALKVENPGASYDTYGTKYAYYPSGMDVSGITIDGYTKTEHSDEYTEGYTEPRFYAWDSGGESKIDENGLEYRVPTIANPVKGTEEFYYYFFDTLTTENKTIIGEMLGEDEAWLASTGFYAPNMSAGFFTRSAGNNQVIGYFHKLSTGDISNPGLGLRPIVTLPGSLFVTGTDSSGALILKTDGKIGVSEPKVNAKYTYTGSEIALELDGFDSNLMTITGNTATNAGTYTATVSLKDPTNYRWTTKGTSNPITIEWKINKALVDLEVYGPHVYSGLSAIYKDEIELYVTGLKNSDTLDETNMKYFYIANGVIGEWTNSDYVNVSGVNFDTLEFYVEIQEQQNYEVNVIPGGVWMIGGGSE